MNLPLLTACRPGMLAYRVQLLTTKYNVGPTNQPAKPPFEGVYQSRRKHRETIPQTHKTGRTRLGVLKRTTQYPHHKRAGYMASLAEMPHNQNRSNDGQANWLVTSHSLPTNKSGQDAANG